MAGASARLGSVDHVRFAGRLLIAIFTLTLGAFWLEFAWDLAHAVDPATGHPVHWTDLQVSAAMVRSLASTIGGAYSTMIALLLTFVSLAIPITANLYTPKLIQLFIRDRINLIVICTCAVLAAHNLLAVSLAFEQWTPQLPFVVAVAGAVIGWLLLLPYYLYVVSFIDPLTIIERVHRSLMHELEDATDHRRDAGECQQRVLEKVHGLGSVLLRAADRGDRDVAIDAVRTHLLEIARLREVKPRLSDAFLHASNDLLAGVTGDAAELLSQARIWVEHQIAGQLVLGFRIVLVRMPDGVSVMARMVKNAAHEQACLRNEEVFHLLVRVLNMFVREAIKHHENTSACHVVNVYKALVRRLIADHPDLVPPLIHHLRYYAGFARAQGLPFVQERLAAELATLAECASERSAPCASELLDAVLSIDGVDQSAGLVKSRVILAAHYLEHDRIRELNRVLHSLHLTPAPLLQHARDDILAAHDRVFWELSDQVVDFDYVRPERRGQVIDVFERLAAQRAEAALAG